MVIYLREPNRSADTLTELVMVRRVYNGIKTTTPYIVTNKYQYNNELTAYSKNIIVSIINNLYINTTP